MPYLGSTLFVVTLLAGLLVAMVGFFLLVFALWPAFAGRTRTCFTETPIRSVLLGAVVGGFFLALAAGLTNAASGGVKAMGVVLAAVTLAFGLAGAGGLAGRIGAGLARPSDEGQLWRQTLRGGVVLATTFLLPLLGWFLILPVAVFGGIGASLRSMFPRRHARTALAPVAPLAGPTVSHART